MVKQMVFKTGYNSNNQKVYICPFCGRSWRKLDNAIASYEQCEQKSLNTLKNQAENFKKSLYFFSVMQYNKYSKGKDEKRNEREND